MRVRIFLTIACLFLATGQSLHAQWHEANKNIEKGLSDFENSMQQQKTNSELERFEDRTEYILRRMTNEINRLKNEIQELKRTQREGKE